MSTQAADDHAMSSTEFSNPAIRWIDYRLPIFTFLHHELHEYPTPRNLNYWWNFGSLAGIVLVIMIVSGIVLAMHYTPESTMAFDSEIGRASCLPIYAAQLELLVEFRLAGRDRAGDHDRQRHRAGDALHAGIDDGVRLGDRKSVVSSDLRRAT